MSETVTKTLDMASRWITPVGMLVVILLQSQFVSRKEFDAASDKLSGRVEKIEQVLIRMESSAETDRRHDNLLGDHEQRLRTLEKKP